MIVHNWQVYFYAFLDRGNQSMFWNKCFIFWNECLSFRRRAVSFGIICIRVRFEEMRFVIVHGWVFLTIEQPEWLAVSTRLIASSPLP